LPLRGFAVLIMILAMYYFAYSSNMSLEHMRRLCGWHFQVLGAASLEGYKVGPDLRGYLTIQPEDKGKVFGVLYTVDQFCLDAMDKFEGHPNVFERKQIRVKDMSNNALDAWVYGEHPEAFGGEMVNAEHLKRVIYAAEQQHLPKEWIKFLESFRTA
jgi:gamma-glutamylcyclotransferase